MGGARLDVLAHRHVRVQLELLRQIPHSQTAPPSYFARIRSLMPCQNPQQARFARSIPSDQPDLLSRRNGQRHGFQQPLVTETQCKIIGRQNGRTWYQNFSATSPEAPADERTMT